MTSVMIDLLLTLWAVPVKGTCSRAAMTSMMLDLLLALGAMSVQGMSTNMANFLTVLNGNYSNRGQYEADNKTHNLIDLRSVPVTTPALPGRTALFIEWAFNGQVLNLQLCDPSEDSTGVIILAIYNITVTRQYTQGQYNVEDLANLKPEDFQVPSTIIAQFERIGPGMYMGTWPDCRHFIKGKPALYTDLLTCSSCEIVVPRSAIEKSAMLPYNFVLEGDKFPVPGLPDSFVSPCP